MMRHQTGRQTAVLQESEFFVGPKIPPLSGRQVPQSDLTDTDSFQSDDFQADRFAHPPDLSFFPFMQYET